MAIKEEIWKKWSRMKKGKEIDIVKTAKEIGCSHSYISQLCKIALDCGFLVFNKAGEYSINRIPKNYDEFRNTINDTLYAHREKVAGSRGPKREGQQRKISPQQIEKLEINEETIVDVIKNLVQKAEKYDEISDKFEKLMKYTKKIKSERDKLNEMILEEDIPEVE